MDFGINNGISAIDSAAIKDVAGQIFSNAQKKDFNLDALKVDYSKFNRATLGADMYSSKLSIDQIQQISIRKAGLDTDFQQNQAILASVQYLNKAAATGAYSMQVTMDGKINVPQEAKHQDLGAREVLPLPASSIITETQNNSSEKKGSNPFTTFLSLSTDVTEDEKDSQSTGIFMPV